MRTRPSAPRPWPARSRCPPASAFPSIRPRDAVARIEIGLTLTNASSAPGSVSGSTKTLLRNVSGKIAMKPAFMTAFGRPHQQAEGREDPGEAEGEHDHQRQRRDHAGHARAGPEAQRHAQHDDHGRRRPGSGRCRPAGRRPAAPAARSAGSGSGRPRPWCRSVLSATPGVDGREQHRHHEDAREDVVQVLAGRSGDRAAEHVGEHQHEHHRRDRHVEELLGYVLDLQHPSPPEGHRRRRGARPRRARGGRERLPKRRLVGRTRPGRVVGSVLMLPAPPGRCPRRRSAPPPGDR